MSMTLAEVAVRVCELARSNIVERTVDVYTSSSDWREVAERISLFDPTHRVGGPPTWPAPYGGGDVHRHHWTTLSLDQIEAIKGVKWAKEVGP